MLSAARLQLMFDSLILVMANVGDQCAVFLSVVVQASVVLTNYEKLLLQSFI